MSRMKLESPVRGQSFELQRGTTVVVGRAHDCDFPLLDPSVSRRHAELAFDGDQIQLRDVGSSNGTFVNGTRVSVASVRPGDVLVFGRLEFTVREIGTHDAQAVPVAAATTSSQTTIVKQVQVDARGNPQTDEHAVTSKDDDASPNAMRETQLLLIDLARELVRHSGVTAFLDRFADVTLRMMPVDCVSLLMLDPDTGDLVPGISKSRFGEGSEIGRVPTSISSRVIGERIAVLTDNAAADVRFGGASIVMQSVRSAMCSPLMGRDGTVLGLFYVDSRTADHAFDDGDLSFLISFAAIAAAAIENRTAKKRLELARHFPSEQVATLACRESADVFAAGLSDVTTLVAQLDGLGEAAEHTAKECMGFLAHFAQESRKTVFGHGGSIDRSMTGDLVAFWGSPVPSDHGSDHAVDAASTIRDLVARLNSRWMGGNAARVTVRIGLATGPALGGNIGNDREPDYALVGPSFDLARQLCALASPNEVLMTESVYTALTDEPPAASTASLQFRESDQVLVYRLSR